MCKSLSEPIIRDITLEEGVLYIKFNKFISIGLIIDSSVKIMF
jgi:hypothetical protein